MVTSSFSRGPAGPRPGTRSTASERFAEKKQVKPRLNKESMFLKAETNWAPAKAACFILLKKLSLLERI